MPKVDLIEIIKANPGCVITVDSDSWWLTRTTTGQDVLVDNHTVDHSTIGGNPHGTGHLYAGDVLQALARIVGVRVESV